MQHILCMISPSPLSTSRTCRPFKAKPESIRGKTSVIWKTAASIMHLDTNQLKKQDFTRGTNKHKGAKILGICMRKTASCRGTSLLEPEDSSKSSENYRNFAGRVVWPVPGSDMQALHGMTRKLLFNLANQ